MVLVLMQCCGEEHQVVVLQQHYQFHTAQELVQARLTNAGKIFIYLEASQPNVCEPLGSKPCTFLDQHVRLTAPKLVVFQHWHCCLRLQVVSWQPCLCMKNVTVLNNISASWSGTPLFYQCGKSLLAQPGL